MSIQHEPKLTIGWRIEQDDIPDFEDRADEEWQELEELADKASEVLGKVIWTDSLCSVEDSWCGDTQMIGVPMFDHELPMDGFLEQTDALAEFAKDVYRQVMRKEPDDEPYLISWTQVS